LLSLHVVLLNLFYRKTKHCTEKQCTWTWILCCYKVGRALL